MEKVVKHIKDCLTGDLTTSKLESLVLDFDEEMRSYKQVTKLREVNGFTILNILESPQFKELLELMDEEETEIEDKKLVLC